MATYSFTYGRGVGSKSQAVLVPCHYAFDDTKLTVYRAGTDGTIVQHAEGELSLVEYPRTRAVLEAGLEGVFCCRGGAMRLKQSSAQTPAPTPAPAPALQRKSGHPLHPFRTAGRAFPIAPSGPEELTRT